MKKTKIVCTIGPASESAEVLTKLVESGMNVARLNFSHGNFEEHGERIKTIQEVRRATGKTVAILLDTKGPEIRTHDMENGGFELKEGNTISLMTEQVLGNEERFSISYPDLINDVKVGSTILIDDGLVGLEVIELDKAKGEIKTKILNTGMIKNKKGVNVPGVSVKLPGITEKDKEDILFGIEQMVDFVAPSFVRKAADVIEVRELLVNNGGSHIQIIPKIENHEGVENIDSILEVADGLMVARGDLGVEIPAEDVPIVQKMLIKKCNEAGKPVITATQMLDSMQRNPRPTRAEAGDVANAIFDGTDAVMLSGETAAGDYPVESVRTMANIAVKAESSLDYDAILRNRAQDSHHSVTDVVARSVAYSARSLDIKAIIAPTIGGTTAKEIARYRPETGVVAVVTKNRVARRLALAWGVESIIGKESNSTDEMLENAVNAAVKAGFAAEGDLTIITAGVPINEPGTTNLMKIHSVGQSVVK